MPSGCISQHQRPQHHDSSSELTPALPVYTQTYIDKHNMNTCTKCIQLNISNLDTLGTEESVLISEVRVLISGVAMYIFGTDKCPVYLISGCPE